MQITSTSIVLFFQGLLERDLIRFGFGWCAFWSFLKIIMLLRLLNCTGKPHVNILKDQRIEESYYTGIL